MIELPVGMRPAWAEIDLDNLAYNVRTVVEHSKPAGVMAVVKANGYGHGAVQVAKVALENGVKWLGVGLVEEAQELRRAGIAAPIHIMSMPLPDQAEAVVRGGFSCAVSDLEVAEALALAARRYGRVAKVQVKVDTGMGRLGVLPQDVLPFVEKLRRLPHLDLIGIYTHFSSADEQDKTYTIAQYETFKRVLRDLHEHGISFSWVHAANSAAVLDTPEFGENLVRPGIILYGLYPSAEVHRDLKLRPVLSLKARLVFVKRIPAGSYVSYGRSFRAAKAMTIAGVPLGYADGWSRLLSDKAEVLLAGRRVPIIGRICMDQFMIAVPPDVDARLGDEVVLIGQQGDEYISAEEVAAHMGTLNYEIICNIGPRIPRVYIKNGRAIAAEKVVQVSYFDD